MKAFLGTCLLFSLVSPVVLVSCRTCKNGTGAECTGTDIKKCESHNELCKSAIADGNVLINTSQALYKCGRRGTCDPGHYSFTTAGGRFFNLVVKCCNTDNCNAEPLELPSQPMPPNGGECSGCYAKRKEKCTGSEVVKCLGNQTKCINMNLFVVSGIKDYPKQIAIRGCGTPDMCHELKLLRSMQLPKFSGNNIVVKCTDAV